MPDITDVVTVEWAPADDPFDTTPSWTDITSKVRGLSIKRGGTGAFGLFGVGTCSITVLNDTPTIDPTVWYRWRQVRVTATATGPASNVIFYGFVSEIRHDQSAAPFTAYATIEAADLMHIIGRYEFTDTSVAEEYSGTRVNRVVDAIGIPAGWQSLDTGYVTIAEPDDGVLNVNALTHCQDATESEVGGLYVSAAGSITFEDRYEQLVRLAAAASATFSDTASGSEVSCLRGQLTLTPPGKDYRNRVTFIGDTGTAQTESDVPANFPPDSLSRTLPMAFDSEALANAVYLLDVFKQSTITWPESVDVLVWPGQQNNLDKVTALDLRRYCIVEFTPVGDTQQTYKVFVDSITHTITPAIWTCRIGFSSADRLLNAWGDIDDYLELDDSSFGLLGTGALAP